MGAQSWENGQGKFLLREARPSFSVTSIFTEVVAIRQLLNTALESIACGEAVTHENFQSQVQTIRSTKHKAAAEVMQQYAVMESAR